MQFVEHVTYASHTRSAEPPEVLELKRQDMGFYFLNDRNSIFSYNFYIYCIYLIYTYTQFLLIRSLVSWYNKILLNKVYLKINREN